MIARVALATAVAVSTALVACTLGHLSAEHGAQTPPDVPESGPRDAARCSASSPFAQPEKVVGVPDGVRSFRLTADETFAYWSLFDGGLRIAAMTSAAAVGEIRDVVVEGHPAAGAAYISDDRRVIFFQDDFSSFRASGPAGGPYTGARTIALETYAHPVLDEASGRLWLERFTEAGAFHREVWLGRLDTNADVTDLRRLPIDNVPSTYAPVPSGDDLYVASNRGGFTGDDIYLVRSAASEAPTIEPVDRATSSAADRPAWVSKDGCVMYLLSARNTGIAVEVFVMQRGR